jgi:hypothetical protein
MLLPRRRRSKILLFAHVLIGEPVSTSPEHALAAMPKNAPVHSSLTRLIDTADVDVGGRRGQPFSVPLYQMVRTRQRARSFHGSVADQANRIATGGIRVVLCVPRFAV